MSETPQERIEKWLAEGHWVKEADEPERGIREAIRAVLDLVRVQYEANEEMTRLLAESRLEWPEVAAANLVRAEAAEAERDALATNVRMAGRSAEHAKAERDALRAKCGDLGASVNIMGKVAVNLGQAKQIAESTLVELQRDDDHDQALLIEALSRLEDERDALRDSYDAAAAAWGRDEQEYLQEVERLRGLLTEWIPRHSAACCTPTPEIGTFPPGPFLPKWCCCDDLSKRSRSALEEKP